MKAHLREKDKEIFLKYIKKGKIIFEYGCGCSTYEMNEEKNIKKIYSVESDYNWIHKILSSLPENHKVEFIFNDFEVETKPWGYPSENCSIEKKIQYSNQLSFINETIDINTTWFEDKGFTVFPRYSPIVAWTGQYILIYGGLALTDDLRVTYVNDGFVIDLAYRLYSPIKTYRAQNTP